MGKLTGVKPMKLSTGYLTAQADFKKFLTKVAEQYSDDIDPSIFLGMELGSLEKVAGSLMESDSLQYDMKVVGYDGKIRFIRFEGHLSLNTQDIVWGVKYVMHDDPISVGDVEAVGDDSTPTESPKAPVSPLQDLTPIEVLSKQVEAFTGILANLEDKISELTLRVESSDSMMFAQMKQVQDIKGYLSSTDSQKMYLMEAVKKALNNYGYTPPPP